MKFVTLNVYGGIYKQKSLAHLQKIGPEVLALQEMHGPDIEDFKTALDLPHCLYVPGCRIDDPANKYGFRVGELGISLMSKTPFTKEQVDYYHKVSEDAPLFNDAEPNHWNRALLSAVVDTESGPMRVSTTHFTWTPDGHPTPLQTEHSMKLAELIDKQNVDILGADFNAPHGAEVMTHIGSRMDDHMPTGVDSTIDPELHRVRGLKIVVDNIFTRKGLATTSMQIKGGASDHKALIAQFLFNSARRNQGAPLPDVPSLRPVIGPADLSQAPARDQQIVP
jgi:endonuclease/exonuclease/phosphatase family metal-dependent hydrolase